MQAMSRGHRDRRQFSAEYAYRVDRRDKIRRQRLLERYAASRICKRVKAFYARAAERVRLEREALENHAATFIIARMRGYMQRIRFEIEIEHDRKKRAAKILADQLAEMERATNALDTARMGAKARRQAKKEQQMRASVRINSMARGAIERRKKRLEASAERRAQSLAESAERMALAPAPAPTAD